MSMERRWYTGGIPKMEGMHRYTEMIRGDGDPERMPRPKGGQKDKAPHRTLSKSTAKDWTPSIRKLLSDGKPRTLNAIGTTLIDKTADITSGTPFAQALWQLVQNGELAFGEPAPILFVLASKVRATRLKAKGRYGLENEWDGGEPEPEGFMREMERGAASASKPKPKPVPKPKPKPKPAPKPKPKQASKPAPKPRELAPWEAARIVLEEPPRARRAGRAGGTTEPWDPQL